VGQKGEFMMKVAKQFIVTISIVLSLTLTGMANTQVFYQGKPPEKVKEKEKDRQPPPKSDRDKGKDRGGDRDDRRGGDKKKKPDFFS